MPFGLGSKNKNADADAGDGEASARASLFSKRNKTPSATSNPYAQAAASPDPYAAKSTPPPAYSNPNDNFRREKSPVPPGGYGGGGGYGANGGAYGAQGGYGSGGANRYGAEPEQQLSRRPGGYGGFGRTESQATMDTQAGKDALFGGAAKRAAERPAPAPTQQQQPESSWGGDESGYGGYGGGSSQSYGAYADRQLTAEEEEEEDVQATKQQIRQLKSQDVSSTRNALKIAAQAEETGRSTLARLGEQGERIHNTEKNLDLASNQNRRAEEKARELKTLNKSMFAMHVSNPFTAGKRREARDQDVYDKNFAEREQREQTRREAYRSEQRQQQFEKDLNGNPVRPTAGAKNLAERSKYQFEADSEDDEMENEIEGNLDLLHGAAKRLGNVSRAMGTEIDAQNKVIDRVTGKTDKVDDQIAMNRARLDRIK
ncbi:MAG: Meiosis-specific subunit of the t-SNARE complex [Bogoriella megaspora]|nr:MAG: Meiosis-specific subunit of the t-SNARE complex [Bogoriella megaspora]